MSHRSTASQKVAGALASLMLMAAVFINGLGCLCCWNDNAACQIAAAEPEPAPQSCCGSSTADVNAPIETAQLSGPCCDPGQQTLDLALVAASIQLEKAQSESESVAIVSQRGIQSSAHQIKHDTHQRYRPPPLHQRTLYRTLAVILC